MRSRATDLLRAGLVLTAVAAAAACVIGPKQDDPATLGPSVEDASTAADTSTPEYRSDTAGGTVPDGTMDHPGDGAADAIEPLHDAGCATDGDAACGDAGPDTTDAADAPEGG